jgi:hypothetical protein
MGIQEMHRELWWINLREKDIGVDERIILKFMFTK